jgi:hypothetical protein
MWPIEYRNEQSMKYMLLIYSPEKAWTPDEWNHCVSTSMCICQELAAEGKFLSASPLHPVATATTVRVREGKTLVTAGPFAETTEQLGGYYILDVANLDEAITIASRLPPAKKGTVEIRPIRETDNLPPSKLQMASPPGMRQFMFLCYDDEQHWHDVGPDVHSAAIQKAVALTHRLDREAQFVSASPLYPTSIATSVRVREGKRQITDGPFAETREVLGGYYLIFARDQAEALAYAAEHPGIHVGAVEVRQVIELSSDLSSNEANGYGGSHESRD